MKLVVVLVAIVLVGSDAALMTKGGPGYGQTGKEGGGPVGRQTAGGGLLGALLGRGGEGGGTVERQDKVEGLLGEGESGGPLEDWSEGLGGAEAWTGAPPGPWEVESSGVLNGVVKEKP